MLNLVVTAVVVWCSWGMRTRNRQPPQVRKRYWNEPSSGWGERAYLFEVVRGLSITGGVFLRNMWKWVTGRKGALTAYYPEENPRRLRAATTAASTC